MTEINLSTIATDISSNFSNINFSYPEVNIDENIKSGYLELFGNSSYLHFNYDSIKIDTDNKIICVIHKSLDNTNTAYIVFGYVSSSSNDDKLYNKPYIHLNHHIANEIIEGSTLKYDSTGFYILGNSSTPASYLIYFKDTKLKLNTDNIPDSTITVPTNISSAGTKLFKRGIFKNDEIDCGASTVGSETIAKNKYATTVSGNLGISIGVGIIIIVAVIATITIKKNDLMFVNGTQIFDIFNADGYKKVYNFCWATLLLLSIICFLAYGGVMSFGTDSNRDSTVSGLLATAIISLILFIFMIVYKGLVLTPAAPAR
jgi:hypothetical protein